MNYPYHYTFDADDVAACNRLINMMTTQARTSTNQNNTRWQLMLHNQLITIWFSRKKEREDFAKNFGKTIERFFENRNFANFNSEPAAFWKVYVEGKMNGNKSN